MKTIMTEQDENAAAVKKWNTMVYSLVAVMLIVIVGGLALAFNY